MNKCFSFISMIRLFFWICFLFILTSSIFIFPITLIILQFQVSLFNVLFCGYLYYSLGYFSLIPNISSFRDYNVNNDFLVWYFCLETLVDLIFIISYLLHLEVNVIILVLFKQGIYPIYIYIIFLHNLIYYYSYEILYLFFYILISKILTVFFYCKIYICLEFYLYSVLFSLCFLLESISLKSSDIIGRIMILDSILFLFILEVFYFTLIPILLFMTSLFFKEVLKFLGFSYLFLDRKKLFLLDYFFIMALSGCPVIFIYVIKFFCLIQIFSVNSFLVLIYLFMHSLLLSQILLML